ncbi:conjugative transposon protein TraM [Chitinophaga sp. 30R24]|uniref:conjugative transposon protein TraM n=1 Tax=Chitinophaga sp. 30R24 TaxID=3248838 RepID=UPI003B90607F
MKSEQKTTTEKNKKKRQFLLVLPFLVIPFITIILYSFGKIDNPSKEDKTKTKLQGFNMNLPGAKTNDDSSWNKLKYYEKADRDSAKYRSLMQNDPYLKLSSLEGQTFASDTDYTNYEIGSRRIVSMSNSEYRGNEIKDPNEEKVYRKIIALNEELNRTSALPNGTDNSLNSHLPTPLQNNNTEGIYRLETMMREMSNADKPDQQMEQISDVLEKILDIQHPERIKDKFQSLSEKNKNQVFAVSTNKNENIVTLMQSDTIRRSPIMDSLLSLEYLDPENRFYSLENQDKSSLPNTVRAVVSESKEVTDGSKVKLRLLEDIYVNGVLVPKNTFVYGKGILKEGRFAISIKSIQSSNSILPVDLSVFDLDGIAGIDVNANMATEVAKQSADQAIQTLSISSLDPSIGAQAATAGIQAAKSLIGRKVKVVKVNIRSGYEVLLIDNNVK